jgi:hypothetical protein
MRPAGAFGLTVVEVYRRLVPINLHDAWTSDPQPFA